MLLWVCDLCNRQSETVLPRGLVWPYGLTRGRGNAMRQPHEALDVCFSCIDRLGRHMYRRGEAPRLGRYPKCCVCGVDAVGLFRIVESGMQSWYRYDWSGHFCPNHLEPMQRRARGTRKYGERRRELIVGS